MYRAGVDLSSNVSFDKAMLESGYNKDGTVKYADGFFDGDNTIYVNKDSKRKYSSVLFHELMHSLYNKAGAKAKLTKSLVKQAWKNMPKERRAAIEKSYNEYYNSKNQKLTDEILKDEVAAFYSEDMLSDVDVLAFLEGEVPGLGKRIVGFFNEAARTYSGDENISREARKYARKYRELYKQVEQRNQGMNASTGVKSGERFALVGRTEDGRGVYRTNYPENTPKDVKQKDIVDLVQNVWSKKPIKLKLIVDGKEVSIEARFNPELTERSDLSKIAFGNRKGTASEKRITMNLSSDLYQIAEESHYVGSKAETGKDNEAHKGVTNWHYFITDLVYVEADGTEIECYMNIDVKQNDSGHWFYSFAIEKGSRPADVLSVVTDKSATTSTISITDTAKKINPSEKNSSKSRAALDIDYLDAVNRGDMVTAQRMVDEAAKEAGYTEKAYHGTNVKFTEFKQGSKHGWLGKGIYFAANKSYAKSQGKRVISVYLNANKVYASKSNDHFGVLSELQEKYPQIDDFNVADVLKHEGYNGISYTDWDKGKIISMFHPNDIKSADPVTYDDDGNIIPLSERFNLNNPDIRFALDVDSESDVDYNYTKEQYERFGWARNAKAISKNELDDLYSKIKVKSTLRSFKQSSKGEAIIEVNDNPHTTLGTNNVFVFVKGTKNNFTISRVIRFDAETEMEMEIIKERVYERRAFSDTHLAYLEQQGFATQYARESAESFNEYKELRQSGKASRGTNTDNQGRKKYGSGYSLVIGEDGEVIEKRGKRFALDIDNLPDTTESVGATRAQYEPTLKGKIFDATTKLYIETVDETFGLQRYLEKEGKRKDAAQVVNMARASRSQAQTALESRIKPLKETIDNFVVMKNKPVFDANEKRANAVTAEESQVTKKTATFVTVFLLCS